MPTPLSSSSSLCIGVNTHLNYGNTNYGNVALVASELSDLGVKYVRDGFHTSVTNQTTPNFDPDSVLYAAWKAVGELGIKFSVVVDPAEKLGTINPSTLNTLMFESCQLVGQFEGQNEPDLGTPSGWPQSTISNQVTLSAAIQGLAQQWNGKIPLLAPSLALPANSYQVKWGTPAPFQNLNWHYYPTANMPNFAIASSIASLLEWGNYPIQVTEFGYNDTEISPAAKAKYTLRGILDLWAAGVKAIYLYELQDEGSDTNINSNWGLVHWDGTYKPAFIAVSNLIRLLQSGDPAAPLSSLAYFLSGSTVSSLFLQHRSNEWLLFLWREVSCYNAATGTDITNLPVPVTVNLPIGSNATVYVPLFQSSPVGFYSNISSVSLFVNDHPTVVKIG